MGGTFRLSGPQWGIAKPNKVARVKLSKQKEAWREYHREKLLKDLPKWKIGHKEDMHKRLDKVFKSYPDLACDRDLINTITEYFSPMFYTGLNFADDELRNDRDVVMQAVKKGSDPSNAWESKAGNALSFASARLRDDKEVVLAAIQVNSDAIFDASDRLQADPTMQEAALTAWKRTSLSFEHASKEEIKGMTARFRAELAKNAKRVQPSQPGEGSSKAKGGKAKSRGGKN